MQGRAPAAAPPCLTVGAVDYEYGIGEFEVTVSQYVTFLNTVDPAGRNPRNLYIDNMSPAVWPQYGSVRYSSGAGLGNTGDVVNADTQPLATYNPNDPNSSVDTPGAPAGAAPTWCPSQAGPTCGKVFPPDLPTALDLPSLCMANVSTVGQAKTPSPWGTNDMGGNVVEILVCEPVGGWPRERDCRRCPELLTGKER